MELKKLTLPEFKRMAALIYERTGIHLPETKLTLLSNRLRKRLKALNLSSYSDYYKLLCDPKSCEDELPHFLSAVTTNETYFFRNERLWKYIRETWIPELVKRKDGKAKTVRVWSAACSTGEEAYTMAICLHEDLCTKGPWRVTIIGSDISPRVLEHAKNARYNDYAVGEVSPAMRRKWFDQDGESYVLKPHLRKMVNFRFHNLRDPFPEKNFDLVFLRNVLMYFDTPMKKRVLQNVICSVAPDGTLIVGDVDPIRGQKELADAVDLEYCGPNVYRKPVRSKATTAART